MSYRGILRTTLETRLLKRIDRKRGDVFFCADFDDLGAYDQVGRVMRGLVKQGRLMKIGYGLYSRTARSPFDDSLVPPKGLSTLREGLKRVGIETLPGRAMREYGADRTTQVPTGRVVGVRRRVHRKVGYNGFILRFERVRPAPS